MSARSIALSLLCEYEEEGKYINLSLNSHLADNLSGEERAFLTALLYTAVERKITYDYYIAAISGRGIEKIDMRTRNILRLGIAQIVGMDKIPDFAAVNETVKLAKNSGQRSFVNGVLRAVVRQKESLPLPDRAKNPARYYSIRYSFPLWIVKKFISVLGEAGAEELLSVYSEIAPTDITVNTNRITREDFIEKLLASGYKAEKSSLCNIGVRISESVDPRALPGYSEGEFFVQDASCSAAISVLSPKSGERLTDVCAAPGGKSFAAAILMEDKGEIVAFDIHESKLSLIESGAMRLGLSSVKAHTRDAKTPDKSLFGAMDKVICDVPCSGLGVLRKKPDLRYKSQDSLEELPPLQLAILEESSKYLKAGGVLLYSTCTLTAEENGGVVDAFVKRHPEFSRVDFVCGEHKSENGELTLYPHIHNTDGFFIALLKRN